MLTQNLTSTVKIDVVAPIIQQTDIFGRYVDLEKYQSKKLFIGFFRHAGCPFCNIRVHTLSKAYESLKAKGLEMIFIFESKEEVMLRSGFHRDVSPIPLIADPTKRWYEAYGLEESKSIAIKSHANSFLSTLIRAKMKSLPVHMMADGESFNTIPAEFLLDEKLVIRKMHYAKHLNDRLSLEVIESFAETGR